MTACNPPQVQVEVSSCHLHLASPLPHHHADLNKPAGVLTCRDLPASNRVHHQEQKLQHDKFQTATHWQKPLASVWFTRRVCQCSCRECVVIAAAAGGAGRKDGVSGFTTFSVRWKSPTGRAGIPQPTFSSELRPTHLGQCSAAILRRQLLSHSAST